MCRQGCLIWLLYRHGESGTAAAARLNRGVTSGPCRLSLDFAIPLRGRLWLNSGHED